MEVVSLASKISDSAWQAETIYEQVVRLDVEFGVSDYFESYLPLRVRLGSREAMMIPTPDRISAWQSMKQLAASLNFALPG